MLELIESSFELCILCIFHHLKFVSFVSIIHGSSINLFPFQILNIGFYKELETLKTLNLHFFSFDDIMSVNFQLFKTFLVKVSKQEKCLKIYMKSIKRFQIHLIY